MDSAGCTPAGPGLGSTSLLAGCPVRSGAEETLVPGLVSRTCCSLWDQHPFMIMGKILTAVGHLFRVTVPLYNHKRAWGPRQRKIKLFSTVQLFMSF